MKKNKVELVSGAGDWSSLITAVENGADSVYFGIKNMNMRNTALNFDVLEIKKIMEFLRKHHKKGYLALNIIVMNDELDRVRRILETAKREEVDAVILWDMAVFSIAKELGLNIHLSTQAGVSNIEALKFFAGEGARRIVLARECRLEDIKKIIQSIKKENLKCEVESFIHGAMCISVSGRCFLSSYSFGKSANRGECLQPCRRNFFIRDSQNELDYVLGEDYILSPRDLCTVDFIDELIEAGITAFKIEGRNRSPEYIKAVVSAYREAIDGYFEGKLTVYLKKDLKKRLSDVYNRGFSSGFYFGYPEEAASRKLENKREKIFLGRVSKFYKKINVAEIEVLNESLNKGDEILFIGRNTPASFAPAEELQCNHVYVDKVEKGARAGIKIPFVVKTKDKVFLWREKPTS